MSAPGFEVEVDDPPHILTIVATPGYELVYREATMPRTKPIFVWALIEEEVGENIQQWVVPMEPCGGTLQPIRMPENEFIRIKPSDEAYCETDWEMARLLFDEAVACLSETSNSDSADSQESSSGSASS